MADAGDDARATCGEPEAASAGRAVGPNADTPTMAAEAAIRTSASVSRRRRFISSSVARAAAPAGPEPEERPGQGQNPGRAC